MNINIKSLRFKFCALALAFVWLAAIPAFGQTVDITILATSDVHNNYLDYDYFTDLPTEQTGLVRIATAIKEIREQSPNVLLFDDGDNIQGNPFGEFLARNPPQMGQISPIMTLLNVMQYDAISLGNHEFNFGLPYLNAVISGAAFPVLSANVVNPLTGTPYFRPYTILLRDFVDDKGKLQQVRVGVLGLLPPQIINESQIRYAEQALAGTAYVDLPTLSAAAPFKAGGRSGPRYYTNVPRGPLAEENLPPGITFVETTETGFAVYQVEQ